MSWISVRSSEPAMKLLKQHRGVPYDVVHWDYGTHMVGETIEPGGSDVVPVNTAFYPHVDILVLNNTDVPLDVGVRIYPVADAEINSYGQNVFRNTIIGPRRVESGQYIWLRSIEEPQLNRVAAVYVTLTAVSGPSSSPTSGTYTVLFLGSKV